MSLLEKGNAGGKYSSRYTKQAKEKYVTTVNMKLQLH
jgi:hypothetical protein